MLAVIESHPVQYHAPVYRAVQQQYGIPVTAIYGSDFSVAGYRDREFGVSFAWDTDLLSGYASQFLTQVESRGHQNPIPELGVRGVGALLRRLQPSAVMLVGYGSRFDREACFEAWRTGLPLLFRAETTDHAVSRSRAHAWMRDSVLRLLYGRMARVLYIGQRSLQHYRRLGVPDERLVFSPYGIDTTPFECDEGSRDRLRAVTRRELELSESDVVAVFSGKLSARKGVDLLVQAAKKLPATLRRRFCMLFLGDGDMRAQLESSAGRDTCVRTRFVGFQNQKQLSRYYHSADLLVLPSRHGETWGLVVNEALHHGLPCVVSDAVGCSSDLVLDGVTGTVCANGSSHSLSEALIRAQDLLQRDDVRMRCRSVVEGYTTQAAAGAVAAAYRAVVGAAPASGAVEGVA